MISHVVVDSACTDCQSEWLCCRTYGVTLGCALWFSGRGRMPAGPLCQYSADRRAGLGGRSPRRLLRSAAHPAHAGSPQRLGHRTADHKRVSATTHESSCSEKLQEKICSRFPVVYIEENNMSKVASVGTWVNLKNGTRTGWMTAA